MKGIWRFAAERRVSRGPASWMELYAFLGHLGKVKIPFIGFFSCVPRLVVVALAFGCDGDPATMLQSGRVVGLGGLEGRWMGPVAPDATGCGGTTTGLMNIGQGSFSFAPFQNTVVIRGNIGPDDVLEGALEKVGADKQILKISLQARKVHREGDPDGIEGVLASGRCRWAVKLTRG
jgi:hypothetical protein